MPSGNKEKGSDYLTVKVYDGKTSKMVTLQGGMERFPRLKPFHEWT